MKRLRRPRLTFSDRAVIRLLAAVCVVLAALLLVAALLTARARHLTACWRAYAQDQAPPPEGDCARVR